MARRAVGRALEVGVAEAAVAALGDADALAGLHDLADQRLLVLGQHLGARRHLDDGIVAVGAIALLAHAGHAVLGLHVLHVAVVDQRVEVLHALDPDVAAAAAIAAVRAAELDELLAPERDAAVAAVAGADVELGKVEEFHGRSGVLQGLGISADASPRCHPGPCARDPLCFHAKICASWHDGSWAQGPG